MLPSAPEFVIVLMERQEANIPSAVVILLAVDGSVICRNEKQEANMDWVDVTPPQLAGSVTD